MKLEFSRHDFKKAQISSFTKIRPVGAQLFHADGRTYDEADSRFRNFANAPKKDRS
jgi:hypothetical protein